MDESPSGLQRLLAELKRRRVYRVAVGYAAVVFGGLEVLDIVVGALGLPAWSITIAVVMAAIGLPVSLVLAWLFDLTPQGPRLTEPVSAGGGALAHPRVTGWHYVTVGMATGLVLASGIYLSVRLVRATSGSDDDSLALAVFPFRPTSSTSVDWSEATADLLTVTLDGTAGLRVLDPWALWRGLRPERSARAETPDPVDAARLATEAGANRFLLGSVIESGDRLDLSVRIYDVASPEPIVTLSVGGSADELADLIQQLAVDVLTRIWRGGAVPRVQELDRVATQSPEALKAYLEAKEAMRRGLVDPAEEAIDRALALDSTFALALVEAVNLKSWVQFMRAELFTGLLDLAQQALVHGDSLSPRNRLRAEAVLASVRTDGARAASNAERIIALDSTDIGAWQVLSYYHRAYGWQYGATTADAIEAAERALGLDPTYTPVLHARAWLSSGTGDAADMRRQIERLEDAEFSALPIQATILGLKAHLASPGNSQRSWTESPTSRSRSGAACSGWSGGAIWLGLRS